MFAHNSQTEQITQKLNYILRYLAEVHFTPIGQTRGRKKSRVVSFNSAHQA